jgi:hypothetical protein
MKYGAPMRIPLRCAAALAGVGAVAVLGGCPGPGGQCQPYKSGANLTSPTQSLRTDVVPIFHASCSLPSCHSAAVASGTLVLEGDAGTIRAGIVGVASAEVPSMPYVTAGDPTQSYLMHKIDGDTCSLPGCGPDGGLCDVTMPYTGALLTTDTRDIIRRWIAQGALDN